MQNDVLYPLYRWIREGNFPLCVVTIPPGEQHARYFHKHDCSEIAIITEGEGNHILDGKTAGIRQGDLILIHPGHTHGYDKCASLGMVNVLYDSQRLPFPFLDGESMPLFHQLFPRDDKGTVCTATPFLHLDADMMDTLLKLVFSFQKELLNGNPGCLIYGLAKFMEFIVLLARKTPKNIGGQADINMRLTNVIEYMNLHFNQDLNLETLQQRSFMSRRSFYRNFFRMTGCSPLDYIYRRRLLHATTLLQTTTSSIKEISQNCGFNSSNYFCRKFREMFQISPQKFRISQRTTKRIEQESFDKKAALH